MLISTSCRLRGKVFDFPNFPDGEWPDGWAHDGGIIGEDGGVNFISLGEHTLGSGIASNDERLTDDDGPTPLGSGQDQGVLKPTRCLNNNPGQAIAPEPPQQRPYSGRIIGDSEVQPAFVDDHVEALLTDIDADINTCFSLLGHCEVTSPLLNSGSWAHSTVRERK